MKQMFSTFKKQVIYNITNLSSKTQKLNFSSKFKKYKNLLGRPKISHGLELKPHQTLWLTN